MLPREDECQRVWITFESGSKGTELVLPLGNGLYRLGSTPLILDELEVHWGDVIEAEMGEDGVLYFQRVVECAPFRHEFYALSQLVAESDEFRDLWAEIEACGGAGERMMGGLFWVHLPEGCTLDVRLRLEETYQQKK